MEFVHISDIPQTCALQFRKMISSNSMLGVDFKVNHKEDITLFLTHIYLDGETTQTLVIEFDSRITNNIRISHHCHRRRHLQNNVCLLKKLLNYLLLTPNNFNRRQGQSFKIWRPKLAN